MGANGEPRVLRGMKIRRCGGIAIHNGVEIIQKLNGWAKRVGRAGTRPGVWSEWDKGIDGTRSKTNDQ